MRYTFLFVLSTLCLWSQAQCADSGQVRFQIVLGESLNDRAHSVVQATNGDYLIAGETESFGQGMTDFFVTRLDQTGNVLWSFAYGTSIDDNGNSITLASTPDGGALVGGWTGFGTSGLSFDAILFKLDSAGNYQWGRYGHSEFRCCS